MGEKITAQVPDGVCRQTVGTQGHEPLEHGAHGNGQRQNQNDLPQLRKVYFVGCDYAVHRLTDENGDKQRKPRSDQCKEQHSEQFLAARLGIR